jgi:hypothetical protein
MISLFVLLWWNLVAIHWVYFGFSLRLFLAECISSGWLRFLVYWVIIVSVRVGHEGLIRLSRLGGYPYFAFGLEQMDHTTFGT